MIPLSFNLTQPAALRLANRLGRRPCWGLYLSRQELPQ